MKRRFFSVSLAFLLLFSLLSVHVMAAPKLVEEFFPTGEIITPKAPFLRYSGQKDNGDSIQIWYNVPKDVLALADSYNHWDEANTGHAGFIARFGVEDYQLYLQTDASIDDGPWQYDIDWDEAEWPGLVVPHNLAFHAHEGMNNNPDKIYENMELSWLTYIEDGMTGFLEPVVIPFTTADGTANYHYDLVNHTLSARCRLILEYWDQNGEQHRIFSPWSSATSIGQNGTQVELTAPDLIDAPTLSGFSLISKQDGNSVRYNLTIPKSVYDGVLYCEAQAEMADPYRIQVQTRVSGGDWQDAYTPNPTWLFSGNRSSSLEGDFSEDEAVGVRARIRCDKLGLVSDWSNTIGTIKTFTASDWAYSELEEAAALDLIPDCLQGEDLTGPITRAEFAAVSVKCYEALTDKKIEPYPSNPFTDTTDMEVLKAFGIGTTNGTGPTTFSPDMMLNREQAATMLTRLYKKIAISGWTLEADEYYGDEFRGMFDISETFADDEAISDWARDSVYFMKAKGILDGVGGNKFAPRALTEDEEAGGYARATREQAILMAKRMVKNLG